LASVDTLPRTHLPTHPTCLQRPPTPTTPVDMYHCCQAEQREKERRQKEKQEAHLYCHVRVATDQDIAQQVRRNGRGG